MVNGIKKDDGENKINESFYNVVQTFIDNSLLNKVSIEKWFEYFKLYQLGRQNDFDKQSLIALGNALLNADILEVKTTRDEESFDEAKRSLYLDLNEIEHPKRK